MVGGVALVVLGVIARAGKLTRQSAVGLRTKATLALLQHLPRQHLPRGARHASDRDDHM